MDAFAEFFPELLTVALLLLPTAIALTPVVQMAGLPGAAAVRSSAGTASMLISLPGRLVVDAIDNQMRPRAQGPVFTANQLSTSLQSTWPGFSWA